MTDDFAKFMAYKALKAAQSGGGGGDLSDYATKEDLAKKPGTYDAATRQINLGDGSTKIAITGGTRMEPHLSQSVLVQFLVEKALLQSDGAGHIMSFLVAGRCNRPEAEET